MAKHQPTASSRSQVGLMGGEGMGTWFEGTVGHQAIRAVMQSWQNNQKTVSHPWQCKEVNTNKKEKLPRVERQLTHAEGVMGLASHSGCRGGGWKSGCSV